MIESSGEGRAISGVGLEALLGEAVRALSTLDAAAVEAMAEFLEGGRRQVRLPRSEAEWRRASSQRWILAHLLGGTGYRLAMLRRIAAPAERFGGYGGEGDRAAGTHSMAN